MSDDQKRFMNIGEAADFLRVSQSKIRKDLREKTIPHSHIGRRVIFDQGRLARWVTDHSVEPSSGEAGGAPA